MARIKQLHQDNYRTSAEIHDDFRNIIKYLNSAERGNRTLAELMAKLFNNEGDLEGIIELRLDTESGLQYRVGEDSDWRVIVGLEDIRGPAGIDFGILSEPMFSAPYYPPITDNQTSIPFSHESGDIILVYKNGLLARETNDYTNDPTNNTVDVVTPLLSSDVIAIERLRSSQVNGFVRYDFDTISTQNVFPISFEDSDRLMVFLNGQFMRDGASNDYVASSAAQQITTVSPVGAGQTLTVLKISNAIQNVGGIMIQDRYCNPATGLIQQNKIEFIDGALPAEKVNGLAPLLAAGMSITISDTEPLTPDEKLIWIDTSGTTIKFKFYNGQNYIVPSDDDSIPEFTETNAGQLLLVHPSGTRLTWGDLDLSAYLKSTSKAAANGVASLDSTGRLPQTQLPIKVSRGSLDVKLDGGLTDGYFKLGRFFKQKISIDGIYAYTTGGTADIDIQVAETTIANTGYAISTVAPVEDSLTTDIEVDALTTSQEVGVLISNAVSLVDLTIVLSYAVVTN